MRPKKLLILIILLMSACNENKVHNRLILKSTNFADFQAVMTTFHENDSVQFVHLNFANNSSIDYNKLFKALNKIHAKSVDLAVLKFSCPPTYINYSMKQLSLITDTVLSADFRPFNELISVDLSVYRTEFPDYLKFGNKLKKIAINGDFDHIPPFIIKLTNLETLIIRSEKLKKMPDNISNLTKLKFLDIAHTGLGEQLRAKKNSGLLQKLNTNKDLIIITEKAMPR